MICIVEDDASLREGLSVLLRSGGYRAAVFESAEALLQSEVVFSMDCLISDVRLPGLSGLDLQRRLTDYDIRIPIIFVTAQPPEVRASAIARGAFAALGKPFDGRVLFGVLEEALRQSRGANSVPVG